MLRRPVHPERSRGPARRRRSNRPYGTVLTLGAMEVTLMVPHSGSVGEPEFARGVIRDLLANWPKRDPEYGLGICGDVVCQVCGEVVTFAGLWATHVVFRHGQAVGGWDEAGRHEHTDRQLASLHRQEDRFCEVCRRSVPRQEMTGHGLWWHCAECESEMRGLAPDVDPSELVRTLLRRRWEHAARR
jgi:ribosomal protein L37AE/L43A